MAGHFYLAPDLRDFAVGRYQECGPFNAHIGFAIHGFFDPRAVAFANVAVFIRQERDAKGMFCHEFIVFLDRILGHAQHDCIGGGKTGGGLGEAGGLFCAARRVVAGVKVENNLPAFEIGKAHGCAAIAREGQVWRQIADFQIFHAISFHCIALPVLF